MLKELGSFLMSFLEGPSGFSESPSLKTLEAYFRRYSLSQIFPYGSYDSEKELFLNQSSVGFVLEALPLVGCTDEIQRQLSSIFQYLLPEGSSIQFLLFADPYVGDRLSQWSNPRHHQSAMMSKIATHRQDFLKKFALNGENGTSIRLFRCFVSFTQDTSDVTSIDDVVEIRDRLRETFRMVGMPAVSFGPDQLLQLVDDLVGMRPGEQDYQPSTLSWNPYDPLCDQLSTRSGSLRVGKKGLSLDEGRVMFRSYGVRRYPRLWTQSMMGNLIGDAFENASRLSCPFFLHYGVRIPHQSKLKMKFLTKSNHVDRQANSPLAKYLPDVIEESEENQFVRQELANNHRFVQTRFSLVVATPEKDINRTDQTVRNIFLSQGWDICPDDYLHLQGLLSVLPMTWSGAFVEDLKICKKLKTTLSTESANLMPIQGEWCGTRSPGMILTGRRGQMFTWSPFDSVTGNYNVAIAGQSGSGKSVFMQELMTSVLGTGGRVFVLDVGRSFEKTCLLLGGQFVAFTAKDPQCLNPFSRIDPTNQTQVEETLLLLKSVICTMAAPTEGTTDIQAALLEQAMMQAWKENGPQCTITHIAAILRQQDDFQSQQLGTMLVPYTKDGLYGRFFEGEATISFTNPFVVLEMEELKALKDLQSVIVQMVIIQITHQMFLGDRLTPFMIVIDEAWDLLRAKQSNQFIETLARRLRKYNGSLVIGTQGVNDFYQSPGSLAAYENSEWVCLLSQKEDSISQLKENHQAGLTPHKEKVLRSVHSDHGRYSEVMITGPNVYAVGRLLLDPFSRILYSTKASEYAHVKGLVDQGLSLEEAVTLVAKDYYPKDFLISEEAA